MTLHEKINAKGKAEQIVINIKNKIAESKKITAQLEAKKAELLYKLTLTNIQRNGYKNYYNEMSKD